MFKFLQAYVVPQGLKKKKVWLRDKMIISVIE